MCTKIINVGSFILLIILGALIVGYGGMDDSPGAQGLGVLGIIFGFIQLFKLVRK